MWEISLVQYKTIFLKKLERRIFLLKNNYKIQPTKHKIQRDREP